MRRNFLTFLVLLLAAPLLSLVTPAGAQKLPFSPPKSAKELPAGAEIETSKGKFEIEFYRNIAPVTIRGFEYLAKKGFYKNLTFHRFEPSFVIQGGDPTGTGKGGPGYRLPPEFSNAVRHIRGSVGMARISDYGNPERLSNGSQFYITLNEAKHLDGLYTLFARVVRGMEVVDRLRKGDSIVNVSLRYGE